MVEAIVRKKLLKKEKSYMTAGKESETSQQTEQTVEYRILQESGENVSVSIPVMGFIVPLADSSQPDLPPNTGKKDPEKPPKTGDTSNLELFVLLALASLLLMLILVVRRRDDDPENKSLENARG